MSTKSYSHNRTALRYTFAQEVTYNGTLVTDTQSDSPSTKTNTGTRTGINNPQYREQVKKCLNASTNFSGETLRHSYSAGNYHLSRRKLAPTGSPLTVQTQTWDVRWCPAFPTPSTSYLGLTEADEKARSDFFKKARKRQRKFQTGVFIGELSEALRMIRNPAKSLREGVTDLLKTVKKRSKGLKYLPHDRKIRETKKVIGDTWLEFAFGWRPLIKDVIDGDTALRNLRDYVVREFSIVKGEGKHSDTTIISPVDTVSVGSSTAIRGWGSTVELRSAQVRYYGAVRLTGDQYSSIQPRLLGLTWSDIVPTAWELIPWSFLIDYFTNIGDVLEAWSFHRADIAWSSKVSRRQIERTSIIVGNDINIAPATYGIVSQRNSQSTSSAIRKTVDRSSHATVFLPSFHFHLPFYNNQWVNIGALVAARRGKGKP